jgi:sugar lactone lactonase YvrE
MSSLEISIVTGCLAPRILALVVRLACAVTLLASLVGCEETPNTMGKLDLVWGRRGISNGRFQKPRAMAIDSHDRIYVVDMTARIQVFDPDGGFSHRWQTPDHQMGKPTGLSVTRDGRLLVADTHYYQVLVYWPDGELAQKIGGVPGERPGEFGLVTDAVEDSNGNLYVAEYGEYDRIQKFAPDGKFLLQWGGHGSEPGQFRRPQNMAVDEEDRIWVADACNHRIQVFNTQGELTRIWGSSGSAPGELYYPYDLVHAKDGTVYVSEFGNHRVQRFTRQGESLGCWGSHGQEEGKLYNPWALVCDSQQRIHVLDTGNHRVQRISM